MEIVLLLATPARCCDDAVRTEAGSVRHGGGRQPLIFPVAGGVVTCLCRVLDAVCVRGVGYLAVVCTSRIPTRSFLQMMPTHHFPSLSRHQKRYRMQAEQLEIWPAPSTPSTRPPTGPSSRRQGRAVSASESRSSAVPSSGPSLRPAPALSFTQSLFH